MLLSSFLLSGELEMERLPPPCQADTMAKKSGRTRRGQKTGSQSSSIQCKMVPRKYRGIEQKLVTKDGEFKGKMGIVIAPAYPHRKVERSRFRTPKMMMKNGKATT
jgi:hypothetical protein